ncbi:MAG: hypothetical protein U0235_16890 [Polyangiaceae bacterium]
MATGDTTWKVLPHGPLTALDDNLWRVEGSLSGAPLKRVMTVVRRHNGGLVLHSPMALEESAMKELEALGPIALLVVPNGYHRLDAPRFAARYPSAKVAAPSGSQRRVEAAGVRVDYNYAQVPHDPAFELRMLKGVGAVEGVMIVRSAGGTTLVFNDAIFNMPHLPGVQGFVLRHLTASSGGFKLTRLFRVLMLKDKAAFRADLEDLARTTGLRRIIVSHHEMVESDAPAALAALATTV